MITMAFHVCGHLYAYQFWPWQLSTVLKGIGVEAADPRLNMTWHDAALITEHLRERCKWVGAHD